MFFHIRAATPADGPGIAFVRVTTWRAAYRGIIAQATLDGLDILADSARFSEGLARMGSDHCCFVAEVLAAEGAAPTRVAGFARAGPCRDDAGYTSELYAIYVLPEYQGHGVGRELFRAVTGWLAGQGHHNMILYVLRDNFPSRRFYETQGGRPVRQRQIEIGGQMLPEVGYGYILGAPSNPGSGSDSGPD
jgi:GNAT superfamily N-acetyltransferase